VIRSIRNVRGEAPLGAWIRRIAVTKSLMFLRSAWHSRGQSLDEDWDESALTHAEGTAESSTPEQAMDLDAALASLPAISRTVVWLHDVEGFTHREIADLMGKTESFSKSQLSRAYQRLRPLLDEGVRVNETEGAAYGSCNATN
jgi:RNA polymerase sigma-70 factor (ECF subfamily)